MTPKGENKGPSQKTLLKSKQCETIFQEVIESDARKMALNIGEISLKLGCKHATHFTASFKTRGDIA